MASEIIPVFLNTKRLNNQKKKKLSQDDINELLKNYILITDISMIPIETNIRYFKISANGNKEFRYGGKLTFKSKEFIVLQSKRLTWCVQLKTAELYKEIKDSDIILKNMKDNEKTMKKLRDDVKKYSETIDYLKTEISALSDINFSKKNNNDNNSNKNNDIKGIMKNKSFSELKNKEDYKKNTEENVKTVRFSTDEIISIQSAKKTKSSELNQSINKPKPEDSDEILKIKIPGFSKNKDYVKNYDNMKINLID